MSIQAVNRDKQNNIYATYSGIIAGTVGAYGGYRFAPRAANNMSEYLNLKQDLFEKSLESMERAKSPAYIEAMTTVAPAYLMKHNPEEFINIEIEGDSIPASVLKKKRQAVYNDMRKTNKIINNVIGKFEEHKGKEISIREMFDTLAVDNKESNKEIRKILTDIIESTYGKDILDEKITIDEPFIKKLKTQKENVYSLLKEEADMYKEVLKLKKDGVVSKADFLKFAKENINKKANQLVEYTSFETFKEFVPRINKGKCATIAGVSSALLTAGLVKLFRGNNNK